MKSKNFLTSYNSLKEFESYLNTANPSSLFAGHRLDSESTSQSKWYGTATYQEANDLLKFGDMKNAKKLNAVGKIDTPQMGIAKQRRPQNSVVGFIPNVANYLCGNPNNMINFHNVPMKKKVVTIIYCLSVGCEAKVNEITNTSKNLINAILGIEANGKRVNLLLTCGLCNKEKNDKAESCSILLKIKDSGSIFDKAKMAYPLINPSFFRRHFFKAVECQEGLTDQVFISHMGWVMAKSDIINVLNENHVEYDKAITFYEIKGKTPQQIEDILKSN